LVDDKSYWKSIIMRICIVTHKLNRTDGQGKVNYEVVEELLRRGYSVTLIASDVSPDLLTCENIRWILVSVEGIPTALLCNLEFSRQSGYWLYKNRSDFDVVVVNGAITSVESDVNVVHFVHSSWVNSSAHPLRQRLGIYGLYQGLYSYLNAYWEKRAFQKAKVLIAVSEQVKRDLLLIGVPEEKIRVVLNGVDLEVFKPGEASRVSLDLPDRVPLGLFVGDIRTNRKNLDTVLKALVEVPDVHLAVVGDFSKSPYPKMADQLGISSRIHFMGFRKDVYEIMRAVDCFVFPSRYEACTLVLLEAMASGLPIITASSAGGCEVVSAKCGYVLEDPEAVGALAQVLRQSMSDSRNLLEMGKEARFIAEGLSWSVTGEAYANIFCEFKDF
jgi:glycosyltransferase involved in cell wall biosynthesis